jgi:hypothetical protein
MLLYVNLYTENLTFKGIMLLKMSNNWEQSDIFINHTDTTLHYRTVGEQHLEWLCNPSSFPHFSTTTSYSTTAQQSVCMTHVTGCWWHGVVAAVTLLLLHSVSMSSIRLQSACGKHGGKRNELGVLMGQHDGKRIVHRNFEQCAGMLKVFTEHYYKSDTGNVCICLFTLQ